VIFFGRFEQAGALPMNRREISMLGARFFYDNFAVFLNDFCGYSFEACWANAGCSAE
jgi:hypothetical protein